MFRLLPLLIVLVGVSASRRPQKQPISVEQQRRICADLCRAGLGGEPCGEVCLDLMPSGIPLQSTNDTEEEVGVAITRADACPILCENRLGYPLCQCQYTSNFKKPTHFHVDFKKICDYYCEHQNWVLRGCPSCGNTAAKEGVRQSIFQDGGQAIKMLVPAIGSTSFGVAEGRTVDWGKWCNQQCSEGNGGSACNCDILPFSIV